MLRKDREITGFDALIDVLARCDTLRIGMSGPEYPYVVPVSFGVRAEKGVVKLYFHGAPRGLKAELLTDGARVCVEGDIFIKVEPTEHGITARYESVIGLGTVRRVSGEEKLDGLRRIVSHYGYADFPVDDCAKKEAVNVYCITLAQLTGKRNLGASGKGATL